VRDRAVEGGQADELARQERLELHGVGDGDLDQVVRLAEQAAHGHDLVEGDEVGTVGRQPEPVEVAAYYVVAEALTNAAKQAQAASVTVQVEAKEVLGISIRDDGVGGADFAGGSGLVGLKDRVEALGGRISVESPRGAGTSVEVKLPLTADAGVPCG
jgi:signal transduction histidine kinase